MYSNNNTIVCGVGINDADYRVSETIKVNGKNKIIWYCPFYMKWKNMITRCYSKNSQKIAPTYAECSVDPEWFYFSKFKSWMETQDWQGKELDKDILFFGNKIYSPDFCVFVDAKTNCFFSERKAARGEYPIGVHWDKRLGKFKSQGCCVLTNNKIYLGLFLCPNEAHKAWLTFKLEQAKILATYQADERVAKALVNIYENYGTEGEI